MDIEFALNPLQWIATADGWIDPSLAPDLEHQCNVIAAAGFELVQPAVPTHMSVPSYKEALGRHGLSAGPGYFVVRMPADPVTILTTDRAAIVDDSRAVATQLADLGSSLVFIGLGMTREDSRVQYAGSGQDFDRHRLDVVRDIVGEVAEAMVGEAGIDVALHPHVGTWIETEHETRYVLDSVDGKILGFGPDVGHLYWAGADVPKLLRDYGSRVRGVHLKDYDKDIADKARAGGWGYQDTVLSGIWREPGTGSEDLAALLSNLPTEWSGSVVLEVDRAGVDSAEESIALCGEWLTRYRTELRLG